MKNLILRISLISLVFGAVTACHTQRIYTNDKAQYEYKAGTVHKGTSSFFVGGIGQTDKIDAVKICGKEENIQAVESTLPFLDGFIGAITLGIYTPREYTVYCK
jgi:hypothetical protein